MTGGNTPDGSNESRRPGSDVGVGRGGSNVVLVVTIVVTASSSDEVSESGRPPPKISVNCLLVDVEVVELSTVCCGVVLVMVELVKI
jgi:hypothetical protein